MQKLWLIVFEMEGLSPYDFYEKSSRNDGVQMGDGKHHKKKRPYAHTEGQDEERKESSGKDLQKQKRIANETQKQKERH